MKKILFAIAATVLGFTSAEAQTKGKACGIKQSHVCRKGTHGSSCYATKFNYNYKVCKGENGYFICCKGPASAIAKTGRSTVVPPVTTQQYSFSSVNTDPNADYIAAGDVAALQSNVAPQNQSYPWAAGEQIAASSSASYRGYRSRTGKIKVCYAGEKLDELNRAPYQGCPTPAFDGIEKNRTRNLNVSMPYDLPPIDGTTR